MNVSKRCLMAFLYLFPIIYLDQYESPPSMLLNVIGKRRKGAMGANRIYSRKARRVSH